MVSSMTPIMVALVSTVVVALSLFLKNPIYSSRLPILWSSFLSWLKPPYLFVVLNVIVTIIIASSKYYQSIDDEDDETDQHIVHRSPPLQLELKDADFDFVATVPPPVLVEAVERSDVVDEDNSGEINGGDEFVVLTSKWKNQVPTMIEESENLPPAEKPLASARSSHRKPVKAGSQGLRVVKPKRHKTLDNTWKMITEDGKSTPLTSHYRRPRTPGLGDVKPALRKAETLRDVTNHRQSSATVTPPMKMKMKKEMSPSREELNRRVEAFIKKCKEERLVSLRLEKEVG